MISKAVSAPDDLDIFVSRFQAINDKSSEESTIPILSAEAFGNN
jgi:hypothetical protein